MNVTAVAQEKLRQFLKDNDPTSNIRISQITTAGSCGGKIRLGLSLDEEVTGDDETFQVNGITFVIERSLNENLGGVSVDYAPDTGVVVKGLKVSTCAAP